MVVANGYLPALSEQITQSPGVLPRCWLSPSETVSSKEEKSANYCYFMVRRAINEREPRLHARMGGGSLI